MRWIWLLAWFGLCFAVAGIGGSWTASEIPGWYRTLVRPAIGATTLVFGQIAPWATWLMAPYWAWVSFAAILNEEYWRLN